MSYLALWKTFFLTFEPKWLAYVTTDCYFQNNLLLTFAFSEILLTFQEDLLYRSSEEVIKSKFTFDNFEYSF